MSQWWQTRDLVLIPLAVILAFAVIVGSQGRRITALEARLDALEERHVKEEEFRDVVPSDAGCRNDNCFCFDAYDPETQRIVRVCRRDLADVP